MALQSEDLQYNSFKYFKQQVTPSVIISSCSHLRFLMSCCLALLLFPALVIFRTTGLSQFLYHPIFSPPPTHSHILLEGFSDALW